MVVFVAVLFMGTESRCPLRGNTTCGMRQRILKQRTRHQLRSRGQTETFQQCVRTIVTGATGFKSADNVSPPPVFCKVRVKVSIAIVDALPTPDLLARVRELRF
jgi:hypothetical protein